MNFTSEAGIAVIAFKPCLEKGKICRKFKKRTYEPCTDQKIDTTLNAGVDH